MDYYRIVTDPGAVGGWFPAEPTCRDGSEVDARTFTRCEEYRGVSTHGAPLSLAAAREGWPMPITFGPFDMPVVLGVVGRKFLDAAPDDVQVVAVDISQVQVMILNVSKYVNCINEERTLGEKWRAHLS